MRQDRPARSAAVLRRGGRALAALLVLGIAAAVSACAAGASAEQDPRPSVVAATPVWAGIAEAVGGDAVRVRAIVPPGQDPHEFQVTPTDALLVTRADVLVANGGGYDAFFADLVRGVSSDAPLIDAFALRHDDGAEDDGHDSGGDAHSDHSHAGHSHAEGPNEHVWFDLDAVDAVARALADDLSRLLPAEAAGFHARADALQEQTAQLAGRAGAIAAAHPGAVVSTEPVAHYLLERAGIDDVTPPEFGEAVEEGSDPAPAVLAQLRRLIADGAVSALVYNTQTDNPTTAAVRRDAERAGLPVVEVGESPPDGVGYTEWVDGILTRLEGAVVR